MDEALPEVDCTQYRIITGTLSYNKPFSISFPILKHLIIYLLPLCLKCKDFSFITAATIFNYVFQKHNWFVCIPRIVESLSNVVNI